MTEKRIRRLRAGVDQYSSMKPAAWYAAKLREVADVIEAIPGASLEHEIVVRLVHEANIEIAIMEEVRRRRATGWWCVERAFDRALRDDASFDWHFDSHFQSSWAPFTRSNFCSFFQYAEDDGNDLRPAWRAARLGDERALVAAFRAWAK